MQEGEEPAEVPSRWYQTDFDTDWDRTQQQWNDTHQNQVHQAQHRVEARIERFGLFSVVGDPVGSDLSERSLCED